MREVFNSHNFKTVPYLAVSKNQVKRDPSADFYETGDIWLIKKDEASDNQILLNFINKRLQNNVELKIPFLTVIFNNILVFTCIGFVIVEVFAMRNFLINPNVWMSIAMCGYVVALSGIVYNTQHNYPVFRFE